MRQATLLLLAGLAGSAEAAPIASQDTILFCDVGRVDVNTFNKPGVQIKGMGPFHPFALFFTEKRGVDNAYEALSLVDPDKVFQGYSFKSLTLKSKGRDLYAATDTAVAGAMLIGLKQDTVSSRYLTQVLYFQPAGGTSKMPDMLVGFCEFHNAALVDSLIKSVNSLPQGSNKK
jgi:hypothetical protein